MTAITTTTTTTDFRTLSPDTDLAERAAGGEQDAFEELYRRHVQHAWRFAQAVSPVRDQAAESADEAFVRVLRVVRRGRSAAAQSFRPYLLAAVYRNSLEALRTHGRPDHTLEVASPDATDEQLLGVAFRSLPERWRAALWLTDVEHMSIQDVAPILGVSTAVTGQMVARARTGLTNRFQQAGRTGDLPDVPAALRAGALALPTGLAEVTLARWKRAMAAERRRVIPAAGWLTDRAPRPLAACAAGLLAMGLIGLGVIGQRGGFGGSTPNGPVSAPSANHQFNGPPSVSLNPIGSDTFLGGSSALGGLGGANGFILPASALLASGAGAGAGGTGSGNQVALGGGSPGSTAPGGTGSPGIPGVPGVPGVPGLPGGGTGTPTTQPVVNASVGPVAVTLGSCTGVGLGPVSLGCTSSTTAPPGVGVNLPGLPSVTVPLPPIALPKATVPPATVPPVTLPPILNLPPITLPPITLPKL